MDWGDDDHNEARTAGEHDALLRASNSATQRLRINTDGFRYSRALHSEHHSNYTRRRPRSLDDSREDNLNLSSTWRKQGYENLFNVSPGFSPKVPIPDDGVDTFITSAAAGSLAGEERNEANGGERCASRGFRDFAAETATVAVGRLWPGRRV